MMIDLDNRTPRPLARERPDSKSPRSALVALVAGTKRLRKVPSVGRLDARRRIPAGTRPQRRIGAKGQHELASRDGLSYGALT